MACEHGLRFPGKVNQTGQRHSNDHRLACLNGPTPECPSDSRLSVEPVFLTRRNWMTLELRDHCSSHQVAPSQWYLGVSLLVQQSIITLTR